MADEQQKPAEQKAPEQPKEEKQPAPPAPSGDSPVAGEKEPPTTAGMPASGKGYGGGRPFWQWILIYAILGGIIYLLIFFLFFNDDAATETNEGDGGGGLYRNSLEL